MGSFSKGDIRNFSVLGTSFTKASSQIRSRFAVTTDQVEAVYNKALSRGLNDFFVVSTCNRTEFYSCANHLLLKEIATEQLGLSEDDFNSYFYFYSGEEAIKHFFYVTSGLASQIIGDYEIVGQVKSAINIARQFGLIGTLTDRISNFAFQASKEVKTKTNLSNGKYSVSFAAAELITARQNGDPIKHILIAGTGEIGQALARNLREYFPEQKITLTNRTLSHAEKLAKEVGAEVIPFETFISKLSHFDAVITAFQADHYLIKPEDVKEDSAKIFVDLSIPQVIDPNIKSLSGIRLYSVDEISAFHNELMKERNLEIPKAELIIEDFISKLMDWQNIFRHTEVISGYKEKMGLIIHNGGNPTAKIEKSFSGLMQQIKVEGYRGCTVIQTVNDLIAHEK
jgi:glutamyl-tRNA reductase